MNINKYVLFIDTKNILTNYVLDKKMIRKIKSEFNFNTKTPAASWKNNNKKNNKIINLICLETNDKDNCYVQIILKIKKQYKIEKQ